MLFGRAKLIEDLKKQLSASEDKVASLEKEIAQLKARELAVGKALTDANVAAETIKAQAKEESGKTKEKAKKELADAQTQSNAIRSQAKEKASKVVAEAEEKAALVVSQASEKSEKLVSEAEEKGQSILAEAKEESQRRLQETEDEVRSYASVLVKLNENMKEQARLAQEASEKYASFYKQMSLSLPGIMNSLTVNQLSEGDHPEEKKAEKPEQTGSVTKVSDILSAEAATETVSTKDILNSIS